MLAGRSFEFDRFTSLAARQRQINPDFSEALNHNVQATDLSAFVGAAISIRAWSWRAI